MSGATRENVQLLRAVVKHPVLYDRSNENYRKRLPSENSWDMVASEVGGSVEKCKRRWRQLRNDYTRWSNADANRRRLGQRRLPYPLHDDFRFLDRHLNLADSTNDEERSGSERERDSNRDSESRDNTTASVKGDDALDETSVNDESSVAQRLVEEDPSTKDVDKDKTKENLKQKKAAQEKSVEKELPGPKEPERRLEEDSYLQSDQEGDEPIEEEHLEQLEDFELEEDLMQEKEKESSVHSKDSPASQSEFFIKQNKEPHLLIIGKKNATHSGSEAPEAETDSNLDDPLDDDIAMEASINESAGKILRRTESVLSPSRRLRRVKGAPIRKPSQGQRVTRQRQRTNSMTLAAEQSVRSSTSPVKMTPVPRPVGASKTVQVRKTVPMKDDYFPRPAPSSAEGRLGPRQSLTQTQSQRQQVQRRLTTTGSRPRTPTTPPRRGRPAKKVEILQRFESPPIRQQSPNTPKVVPITKPSSSAVNTGANVVNKSSNPTSNPTTTKTATSVTKRVTATTLKPLENVTVMSFTPIPSSSPAGSTAKTISKSSPSVVPTSVAAVSTISPPPNPSVMKRCERTTQTESPGIFSDEHFLEMIRPQMKEMNARQKMHFKKKVFQALMETFDDATDFPEAGELQHFNINTPSGFEHVSTPELRLIRELVSMVSAAKVSARGQPQQQVTPAIQPQPQSKEAGSYTAVTATDSQRGGQKLSIPSHLIQRVYKPGAPVSDTSAKNTAAPGGEKKMYRFLKTTNGKPNGISASLEDLRKDSEDSEQSVVSPPNIPPPASPKGATVVAAVRPQGSSISSLFGPSSNVTAVKTGPSLKARAMARRFSTCNNPAILPISPGLGYPSSLNSNLTPMEANALKRRLMAPAQPMVLPTQRPRYSGLAGVQQIVTPHGSLLVKKSIGTSPGNQKQQVSPTGGVVLTPQKTPQIANVQGAVFKDFVQPKPTAVASPVSSASTAPPSAGEATSQAMALKRSLVVANAKSQLLAADPPVNKPQQPQPQPQKTNPRYASMTAATIAADDFSLASLKREPADHMDDQDDILGM